VKLLVLESLDIVQQTLMLMLISLPLCRHLSLTILTRALLNKLVDLKSQQQTVNMLVKLLQNSQSTLLHPLLKNHRTARITELPEVLRQTRREDSLGQSMLRSLQKGLCILFKLQLKALLIKLVDLRKWRLIQTVNMLVQSKERQIQKQFLLVNYNRPLNQLQLTLRNQLVKNAQLLICKS
jgi:hypothetical protein